MGTDDHRLYDFVAVGLGPFNLGLACLSEPLEDLNGIFLEARDQFDWHPGMMLEDATLQVPFLADLVTMADPTSPYSFLNYLKQTGRLYSFYIRESFYPLRREYNHYCQWAAEQLSSVRFGQAVEQVTYDAVGADRGCYVVTTTTGETYRGRRLVLGIGARPAVPNVCRDLDGPAIHSAHYLEHKSDLQHTKSITVVGSGQSAAEIYADLLADINDHDYALNWVTRSPRFFPMEYTKLTLELTSPEYSAHFRSLPSRQRQRLLREQRSLYKGISSDTIDAIFDRLYSLQVGELVGGEGRAETTLLTCTAVTGARWDGARYSLDLQHTELDQSLRINTESLVLATGYAANVPAFVAPISDRIRWDDQGRYAVSPTYAIDDAGDEIFVQNAEEHTHGFVAPDLGMGAYRCSVLIAAMLGREVYPIEKRIAFQEFGIPDHLRVSEGVTR